MNSRRKILYVDDEELNIKLFEFNFSKKYDLITGCCGLKGLDLLEKHPDIQLVISDMKMPNMNGLEFISIAKEKYNDKKFFILTGYDISDEITKAIETRLIVKCFRKPFNKKEIDDAIEESMHDA